MAETSCYGSLGEPVPCGGFNIYNSYRTDPLYQGYYIAAWGALLAIFFLATLPSILTALRRKKWRNIRLAEAIGLHESWSSSPTYTSIEELKPFSGTGTQVPKLLLGAQALGRRVARTTLPLPRWTAKLPLFPSLVKSCHSTRPLLPFSLGTLAITLLIPLFILATLFPQSDLVANPNRFGFLALASLPPLFLLSSKVGPVIWLTNQGWAAVNFLHRWLGRGIVLLVFLHAYFWTVQWVPSRQVGVFLSGDKEVRGLIAFAFLLLIGASSIGPMRRFSYPLFFTLHYTGIIGFLVYVNLHTVYAQGWVTWSVVIIYGVDLAGRVGGTRFKYVRVEALEGGMTRVQVPSVVEGWKAGQHVSLRLFFVPTSTLLWSTLRMFEAHPFSIATAPSSSSVLNSSSDPVGMEFYIKSLGHGSWTGDLHSTASAVQSLSLESSSERIAEKKKYWHVLAMLDGPYGGLGPTHLIDQESILLLAGGSGLSHVLSILDSLVAQRASNGRGGRISLVWTIRDRGQIAWFEARLRTILERAKGVKGLVLSMRIYITCDPSLSSSPSSSTSLPTAFPPLPSTQLNYSRPLLSTLVQETVTAALAPCGRCWPVCYCGDVTNGGEGECVNEEGGCCDGPGDGRELFEIGEEEEEEQKDLEKGEKGSIEMGVREQLEMVPALGGGGGCCSPTSGDQILPSLPVESCCAPSSSASTSSAISKSSCCVATGPGCCSGRTEGPQDPVPSGPLRVRTSGLMVLVCGPPTMIGETRNAVAMVPIARQVRIGGIELHVEGFSV